VSRTRHSVPSAVHGRAWTKNRENNPMQSSVDPGSQHSCSAVCGGRKIKGPNLISSAPGIIGSFEQARIEWRTENFRHCDLRSIGMSGIQKEMVPLLTDCRRHLQQCAYRPIKPTIPDLPTRHHFSPPVRRQPDGGLNRNIGRKYNSQQLVGRGDQIAIHVDQHLQQGARWMVCQIDDPPAL
jgi:hypothetical protein